MVSSHSNAQRSFFDPGWNSIGLRQSSTAAENLADSQPPRADGEAYAVDVGAISRL
jgi:hypothetical protein